MEQVCLWCEILTINNFHVKQNCSTFGTLVTYIFSHSQCESHISSTIFPNVNNDQGFWRILAVCRFRKCWPHRKLAATAFSQMLHGSSTADSFHRNLFRRQPLKPEPFLKAFLYKICNLKVQEMEIFQFIPDPGVPRLFFYNKFCAHNSQDHKWIRRYGFMVGVADRAFFKKMNIFIEWIIRLFFEWINSMNEYFCRTIEWINSLNEYFCRTIKWIFEWIKKVRYS